MNKSGDSDKGALTHQKTRENTHEELKFNQIKEATFDCEDADYFYKEYANFFAKINETFVGLQKHCQGNLNGYFRRQSEIKEHVRKDDSMARDAGQFIREKTEELVNLNKTMDQHKANIKEFFENLTAKKLLRLKHDENEILGEVLKVLYEFYYGETKEAYNWIKFKKDLMEQDKLIRDFELHASVADYANLSMSQRIALEGQRSLLRVKTGEKPTIRLLAFLDNIFNIINIKDEIEGLQIEIPAVRISASHRMKKAHLEAYAGEILHGNIGYLRTLHQGIMDIGKTFEEEEGKFKEMKEAYKLRKKNVEDAEDEELEENIGVVSVKSIITNREYRKGTTMNEDLYRKNLSLME